MKLKSASFLIACLLTSICCQSQNVPLGQWTDYLSYQQGLTVCQGGSNIYCCCSSGVYSYNLSDNSIQRYNKVTGLSDIGCTVARYNPYNHTLVIGYSDGNIDLVTNNQVVNIPDLKNSSALGSKTINNIYFQNNYAYISCGQGLMVIDMNQDIILDYCNIGPFGSALNIYSTTIFHDTIFSATAAGIYYTLPNANISDYQNWQVISTPLPSGIYNGIITCGNKMYASFANHLSAGTPFQKDTLFVYSAGKWKPDTEIHDNIYSLDSSTVNNIPYLIYTGYTKTVVIDTSGIGILQVNHYSFTNTVTPNDAILGANMNLWIADNNSGLIQFFTSYTTSQNYFPPGPFSNSIFALASTGSYLYIAAGGYDQSEVSEYTANSNIGISAYSNGSWYELPPGMDSVKDLCCVAIDPKNPLHGCAGSWGYGVIEYTKNVITNVYDTLNSSLLNVPGNSSSRVGGVGFDTNGNLWATNSQVKSNYLSVKRTDGTWQSFDFAGIIHNNGAIVTKLLITKSGAKWMLCPGAGILVYQDYGTFAAPSPSNSIFISDSNANYGLPSSNIYCMTQDLNGAIWIGTDTRVVVFYSPDNVLDGAGDWYAQNVYVQETGYTQYLMQDQFTTCIAVDGANRKWIGTLGGGVFLMSADGTQQILNFTSSNSPLLSNNILSISINQQTGEVFFGTDQGLVSYRGDATEGNPAFSNVYAYPDPVPHGYTGPIAIKNLVTNSDVKIATVSGEIVYHTIALGGQAVWYGTNFNGERVQTGVYLVFCTSPDGTQSLATKLLFIN